MTLLVRAAGSRGDPETTRLRLLEAAAHLFNSSGYQGTDSNAIARAAGYSPGTFYKHFVDKRAIFLAVYASWVSVEWAAFETIARSPASAATRARRLVKVTTELHRTWRGFRASLRALVAWDGEVRAFHQKQRRRQLRTMAKLREATAKLPRTQEENALLLFTLERVCDAIADGETEALGLRDGTMTALLEKLVASHLA